MSGSFFSFILEEDPNQYGSIWLGRGGNADAALLNPIELTDELQRLRTQRPQGRRQEIQRSSFCSILNDTYDKQKSYGEVDEMTVVKAVAVQSNETRPFTPLWGIPRIRRKWHVT